MLNVFAGAEGPPPRAQFFQITFGTSKRCVLAEPWGGRQGGAGFRRLRYEEHISTSCYVDCEINIENVNEHEKQQI